MIRIVLAELAAVRLPMRRVIVESDKTAKGKLHSTPCQENLQHVLATENGDLRAAGNWHNALWHVLIVADQHLDCL